MIQKMFLQHCNLLQMKHYDQFFQLRRQIYVLFIRLLFIMANRECYIKG